MSTGLASGRALWPRCGACHDLIEAQGPKAQAYLVFELHGECAQHDAGDEYHRGDNVAIGHRHLLDALSAFPTMDVAFGTQEAKALRGTLGRRGRVGDWAPLGVATT